MMNIVKSSLPSDCYELPAGTDHDCLSYNRKNRSILSLSLSVSQRKNRTSRSGELLLACHCVYGNFVFAGCNNGAVVMWSHETRAAHKIRQQSAAKFSMIGLHIGHVFQVQFVPELSTYGLLLSSSADRTLKVWDPLDFSFSSGTRMRHKCVQKITGHGGSITSFTYAAPFLVTACTDGCVRIMLSSKNHGGTLYPYFEVVQTLRCHETPSYVLADTYHYIGDSHKHHFHATPTTVARYRRIDAYDFIVGDSAGYIYHFCCIGAAEENPYRLERAERVHSLGINCLQVISMDNLIITTSFDQSVRLQDAQTHTLRFVCNNRLHQRYVSIAWNEQHQDLWLLDEGGRLEVWNVLLDKCLKILSICDFVVNKRNDLTSASISLAGNRMLVCMRHSLQGYDICRNAYFNEHVGHCAATVAIFEFEDKIVSASLDMSIRFWTIDDMACISMLHERHSSILRMLPLQGTSVIITGHENGFIKMWNVDSLASTMIKAHEGPILAMCAAIVSGVQLLFTATYGSSVLAWEILSMPLLHDSNNSICKAASAEILCMAWSDLTETLYVGGNDSCIHAWSFAKQQPSMTFKGHKLPVTSLVFDNRVLFSASDDNTIRLWEIFSGVELCTLESNLIDGIRDLIITSSTGMLACCTYSGKLLLWDYTTRQILRSHSNPERHFLCLAYCKSTGRIFAGAEDGSITSIISAYDNKC